MTADRLKRMGEASFALYCDPFAIEFPSTAGWLDGSVKSRSFMQRHADLGPWERWVKVAGSFIHKWLPEGEAYYVVHADWRKEAFRLEAEREARHNHASGGPCAAAFCPAYGQGGLAR